MKYILPTLPFGEENNYREEIIPPPQEPREDDSIINRMSVGESYNTPDFSNVSIDEDDELF